MCAQAMTVIRTNGFIGWRCMERRVYRTRLDLQLRAPANGWILSAAGDSRQQQHLRRRPDRRVEPLQEPDVLAVDEDVEERRNAVSLAHPALECRVCGDERGECLADGCRLDCDSSPAPGIGAQDRWDAQLG